MKVLITGGAGFIGSHLADRLLKEGHQVISLDNLDNYYDINIKKQNIAEAVQSDRYTFIEGDIRNEELLQSIFSDHRIDLVVHLAARAGVRPSIKDPKLYYDVNITGTLRILEAMKEANVRKMIFASSSSVYGNNKKVPFSEEDNVDFPISPYAATKKACELMCYNYHHLYHFDIFCMRFFSVYGPRQRPEMAISAFTRNILNDHPIQMFGDGSSARDYTYIDDIVQGVLLSMEKLKGYDVFNIGESSTITLKGLIEAVEEAIGKKAIVHELPHQPGDVQITYADISKAKKLLGYEPSTNIVEGIRAYVKWWKTFSNLQ